MAISIGRHLINLDTIGIQESHGKVSKMYKSNYPKFVFFFHEILVDLLQVSKTFIPIMPNVANDYEFAQFFGRLWQKYINFWF